MQKKKLMAVILSAAMLLPTNAFAAETSSFKDLPNGWSRDAVTWMVENDLMHGSNGNISPRNKLIRAEMAAIMNRATGASTMGDLSAYTDVDAGSWYHDDMSKAVSAGTFKGSEGKLRPESPITREEAFAVIARAAKLTEGKKSELDAFSDASDISEWAVSELAAMRASGYIQGANGKILPKSHITREEFSQVLYNMKDAFKKDKNTNSESDKSEIKDKETPLSAKPSTGGSSGSSSGGSGGGGGSSNPSTTDNSVENVKLVTEKTKLVDLSWSQFVTVQFTEGNNLKNCKISIDGTDVTSAFTPVSTDGSVVKWEITNLNPAKLTVTRNDGKKQVVELSKNLSPEKPQLRTDTSAGYMVAHGPVAVWDYYLPNYDKNGNLRIEPATTLINLNNTSESTDAPAFYSPVAEISESGKGEVIIMFNQRNASEKAWFAGIKDRSGSVQLVSHDEYLNTINNKLNFTLESQVPHGSSTVAEVKIPLGQNGLTSNGRYFVRIKSDGHDSVLVPIHVVNETAPKLSLDGSGSAVSGQNMCFKISGMVYGIKNPTVAAELSGPDGKTVHLTMIEDWYQIGDKLFLYNTVNETTNQGKNNIPYNGKYTLTVHSDGFKDMSCTFFVTGGKDYSNEGKTSLEANLKLHGIDAVTSATSSGGGTSGGGTSGGRKISADLKFDADLLINSMLTERIGIKNETASAIVDRWEADMAGYDTVSSKQSKKGGFEWSDYITAVASERNEGKYLCFADYAQKNAASEKNTIAHSVKSVLEDNKLGDIQVYGSWLGINPPALKLVSLGTDENSNAVINEISEVNEGNPAYLFCENEEYISNITGINLNGNSVDLERDKDFSILKSKNAEGGKVYLIKINPVNQKFMLDSNNLLRITAKGYKQAVVSINYVTVVENVSLKTEKSEYNRGENVVVLIEGSDGSYLKKLHEAIITKPDGNETRVAHRGYFSFTEYYSVEGNKLIFHDENNTLFKQDGIYHISLKVTGYNDKKTPDFTIKPSEPSNPSEPGGGNEEPPTAAEAPSVTSADKVENPYADSYYEVKLKAASQDELNKYYRAIKSLKVNDAVYNKVTNSSGFNSGDQYILYGSYGSMDYEYISIRINSIRIPNDKAVTVTVSADGYKDLSFVLKNGKLSTEQGGGNEEPPTTAEAPSVASADKTVNFYGESYYDVKLKAASQDELDKYCKAVKSLKVNDAVYNKVSTFTGGEQYILYGEYGSMGYEYRGIRINSEKIPNDKAVTVTVTADGYKDLSFVLKNGKLSTEQSGG
ncbi:MAG: S-layer homology domain-containing protein, partial [Anaerovoracaceae bacterium]